MSPPFHGQVNGNLGTGGWFRKAVQVRGGLAQLGERRVRNAEVEGSNPLPSTRRVAWLSVLPSAW